MNKKRYFLWLKEKLKKELGQPAIDEYGIKWFRNKGIWYVGVSKTDNLYYFGQWGKSICETYLISDEIFESFLTEIMNEFQLKIKSIKSHPFGGVII